MLRYSYTYIERSIRNGVLEDLEDHRVGPSEGTVRSVGSVIQPAKQTRNKYSEADDRILWDWVHENPQKSGGTDGNEIYKQLEAKVRGGIWLSGRRAIIILIYGTASPTSMAIMERSLGEEPQRQTESVRCSSQRPTHPTIG